MRVVSKNGVRLVSEFKRNMEFELYMEATFPEEQKEYVKQLFFGKLKEEENFEK